MLTIKTLRFYEKEGLLTPAHVDSQTGYRLYQTSQLQAAARIKALRQLGIPVEQIKAMQDGANAREILQRQEKALMKQQSDIAKNLSVIRHLLKAIEAFGEESEKIKFREVPETKVLSIYHQGAYDNLGEAYAFIAKYAEDNGYKVAGYSRESYINGIWNKDSVDKWLTEIQLPVE